MLTNQNRVRGNPETFSNFTQRMQNSRTLSLSPITRCPEMAPKTAGEGMTLKVSLTGCKNVLSHINSETSGEKEIGGKVGGGREIFSV